MNDLALELEHHFAALGEGSLHYVTAGAGLGERPPIVLLRPRFFGGMRKTTGRMRVSLENGPVTASFNGAGGAPGTRRGSRP